MAKLKLTIIIHGLLLFCLSTKAQTDCTLDEKQVIIQIKTDEFAFENSYLLKNSAGDTLLERPFFIHGDSLHSDTICVPKSECLTFAIRDKAQNGLCCIGLFSGYYKILIDNELQAEGSEFSAYEFAYLGCSEGSICEDPFPVTEGIFQTPIGNGNTWYEFTPDTSGLFNISTCFPENTCNTTFWAYEYCNPFNEFSTIQGTLFYAEDDCGERAEIIARLIKGNTYHLRIGSSTDDCRSESIKWQLEFLRAEIGCMDSLACNFNAVATIDDGTCLYAGDPNCPDGPDLIMGQQAFESSMRRDVINNQNTCLRDEGCLRGYGPRTVIRFDTEITNIGEKDFYVGIPPNDKNQVSTQWEYDGCHNHWHYEGYARYLLFDEDGNEIPIGFKNGFCVLDLECPNPADEKFSCEVQGLSVGCTDVYDYFLDCQWIDITDIPDGKYSLVAVVNWDHSPDATGSFETDYSNNWAQVCIEIFRDTTFNYIGYHIIPDCDTYVDCLGIPNGTAQLDCESNCNGSVKKGDIVRDSIRNLADVNEYITESLEDTLSITTCNDLNLDGKINVIDASLILECFLHEGAPNQPGHSHAPCEFTFTIHNQFDSIWLAVGDINLADEYVDIMYRAPYGKPEAFEFELEGVNIKSVLSLDSDFTVSLYNDDSEIIGLSFEEKSLSKTIDYQPFIRVFVNEFLSDTICINHVEAVLNENLESMQIAGTECGYFDPVNTFELPKNDFYSTVIPNPINGTGRLVFDNADAQPVLIEFCTLSGKKLKSVSGYRGDVFPIQKNNFPSGISLYKIIKKEGTAFGKIIFN